MGKGYRHGFIAAHSAVKTGRAVGLSFERLALGNARLILDYLTRYDVDLIFVFDEVKAGVIYIVFAVA